MFQGRKLKRAIKKSGNSKFSIRDWGYSGKKYFIIRFEGQDFKVKESTLKEIYKPDLSHYNSSSMYTEDFPGSEADVIPYLQSLKIVKAKKDFENPEIFKLYKRIHSKKNSKSHLEHYGYATQKGNEILYINRWAGYEYSYVKTVFESAIPTRVHHFILSDSSDIETILKDFN